jgi:hypothetical protein
MSYFDLRVRMARKMLRWGPEIHAISMWDCQQSLLAKEKFTAVIFIV